MPFCSQPNDMVCVHMLPGVHRMMPILVFLNQDAFDKFRLSKEDYELQKELEKEQQKDKEKASIDPKKDKKKDPQTDTEKKDEIKNILVELNGLEDRIIRLTPNSSNLGSTIISKDGETLYYLSAFEGGFDLWKMDLRKKETKLLHKMNADGLLWIWTKMENPCLSWEVMPCKRWTSAEKP